MTDHPNRSADIAQACAKFVMWCMNEGSFEGCDINGGEAQDKAVELGLLDATTYDPNRHGPSDCCEQGDNWYVPRPELISLLSGAPAQGAVVRDALLAAKEWFDEEFSDSCDLPHKNRVSKMCDKIDAALASQLSPAATVETDDITERAKNCTYGNPDCQRCNPVSRCSAGSELVAREASDLADKIEYALRTEGEVKLHKSDGLRALYAIRTLAASHVTNEPQAAWMPVETAPHAEKVVLGWFYNDKWECETGYASQGWSRNGVSTMSRHGQATHWQPLPSALTRPTEAME